MSKEKDYWNKRYSQGGNSGLCSVGKLRSWRHSIIRKHVSLKNKSILDVGCGDLRFWQGFNLSSYTGLDISEVIIEQNKIKRPKWQFICADVSQITIQKRYDVVFCFEMLFHILSETAYIEILKNLNRATKGMLFISCWREQPTPLLYPHYQAHYQLEDFLEYLPDLELVKKYTTKTGLRALYVFKRR